MSRTFTLSGNSSVLSANYFPPIELKEDYVCGLIDFHTYYSIPNIDEDNNLFHIGKHVIELPVGSYEFDDIANFLKSEYRALKLQDNDSNVNLDINANNNTMKTEVFANETIYFNKPRSIGPLLGFSSQELSPKIIHSSDQSLMITQNNVVRIECSIVGGSYLNNAMAHTLHEFSINVEPGYKIDEIPKNVIYLPVTVKEISTITVRVVNQNGKILNFRGETITLRLHLKPSQ